MSAERTIRGLLDKAEIEVNGSKPYDIQIHDDKLYSRVLAHGNLWLWEWYIDKQRDCEQTDEMISRLLTANLEEDLRNSSLRQKISFWLSVALAKIKNPQNRKWSRKVIDGHYELPVELYEWFLDPYNQYTCGYFKDTEDLDQAQINKMMLIGTKLWLDIEKDNSNIDILDIWCWWWWLAKFLAETYWCKVTWITITDAQIAYARTLCKDLPVNIIKLDYRDLSKEYQKWTFDKVVSVWMAEHVGPKNYWQYMSQVEHVMKDDWVFVLHNIGSNISLNKTDWFIDKYIFPNWVIPSETQLSKAAEWKFLLQDFQNIGSHYDPTLMAWYHNFIKNRDTIKNISLKDWLLFDERFKRMWEYYLLSCAWWSRSWHIQLFHNVYTKSHVPNSYESIANIDYSPARTKRIFNNNV